MMTPREAELTEQLRQKDELLRQRGDEIARFKTEIKLLEQKVDLLVRRIYGARSEKLNAAQLELLLLQEDAAGKDPASLEDSAEAGDSWEAEPKRSSLHRGTERAPRLPE